MLERLKYIGSDLKKNSQMAKVLGDFKDVKLFFGNANKNEN